jgi:hypothetical protein
LAALLSLLLARIVLAAHAKDMLDELGSLDLRLEEILRPAVIQVLDDSLSAMENAATRLVRGEFVTA